ncbi:exodeoxyribonuclease VII small subunit [Sphingomonas endolithica]|uniref:exodeoxyribonuclease VII small subunit n=1 Tax=Sphingomonas endolithica TaxID=2972485 RepID=UPI0021AE5EE8|nr:exodeoxyribonuclease VII small subunit [Sphingomonas sp. ZFBP2030]
MDITPAQIPVEDLSFEAALRELEAIVGRLESGDEPLEGAIALYERGDKLRQRCKDRLDAAQARIESIRTDADGRAAGTQPFAAG